MNLRKIIALLLVALFLFSSVSCVSEKSPEISDTDKQGESQADYVSNSFGGLTEEDAEDYFSVEKFVLPPLLDEEEFISVRFLGDSQGFYAVREIQAGDPALVTEDSPDSYKFILKTEILYYSNIMELQWTFDLVHDLILGSDIWRDEVMHYAFQDMLISESGEFCFVFYASSADGVDTYMCKLDRQGEPVPGLLHLEKDSEINEFLLGQTQIDGYGNIYMQYHDGRSEMSLRWVAVFSPTGEFIYKVGDKSGDYVDGYQFMNLVSYNSSVYVTAKNWKDNFESSSVFRLDMETQDVAEREIQSSLFTEAVDWNGYIYAETAAGIWRLDLESGESIPFVLWKNLEEQVVKAYHYFFVLSDDRVLVTVETGNTGLQGYMPVYETYLLEREKRTERDSENGGSERKILTIGGCGIAMDSALLSAVNAFNRGHTDIRAEIVDYTESQDGTLSRSDSIKQMNMRIVSGEAPDVFYDNGSCLLNFPQYAAMGLLEDINALITADSSFDSSAYSDLIFSFTNQENQMFYSIGSYSAQGFLMKKTNVPSQEAWTIEAFESFVRDLPGGKMSLSEIEYEYLLQCMVHVYFSSLVDYSVPAANFDTANFKNILRFCKEYGMRSSEMDWDKWERDSLRREEITIGLRFGDVISVNEWRILWNTCGSDVTVLKYPGIDSDGWEEAYLGMSRGTFAISAESSLTDAAWDLVKLLWSEETQNEYMKWLRFPVLHSELSAAIDMVQVIPEGEYSVNNAPLPDEGVEELLSILNGVTRLELLDWDIFLIVWEESQAYFEDQKDIDTTARIIQNRVMVHLNQM